MGLLGNELSLVSQIPFYKGLGWLVEEALHCWLTECLFSLLSLASVMSCLQSTLTCCAVISLNACNNWMGVKGTLKVTLSHFVMLCRRKDVLTQKLLWWH